MKRDASSGSLGQPDRVKRAKGPKTSAEQPVPDPSSQGTICFITHGSSLRSSKKPEMMADMLLSLHVAMRHNPDVICVCLSSLGANARLTSEMMEALCVELQKLESDGKAQPISKCSYVVGVICIYFTPLVRQQEIDPECGFPAMLLSLGSLVVVAASWPQMPMRACHRVFSAYMEEAMNEAHRVSSPSAAQAVGIVVAGNFHDLHLFSIDSLAAEAKCQAAHNGSSVLFLAGCLTSEDIKILQIGEPCVAVLQTRKSRDDRSVAQPAPVLTLRENTPLYYAFLDSMQGTEAGKEILDLLATTCFKGDYCNLDERGNRLERPCTIGYKMEIMLRTVLEQRSLHIDRLVETSDPRVPPWSRRTAVATLPFTEDDMRMLMNIWRDNVHTWMNPQTLRIYWQAWNYHHIVKSTFSTYLQHLSGCKFLLRSLIALPIISPASVTGVAQPGSVVQPKILRQLARDWTTHKQSPEHLAAIQRSQPSDQTRLSFRLYRAQTQYKQGAKLSRSVMDGTVAFWDLNAKEQQMVEDYDSRRSARFLDTLLAEHAAKAQPYRGAGVVLQIPSLDRAAQPEP